MKLYYSPNACSLSPHILMNELGLPCDYERVDLATKKMASGEDYLDINPKGSVPALKLDDGAVLTEGPAIVQYLADLRPDAHMAPPNGTFERYQLQELLNYISTEIHKNMSSFFNPGLPKEWRAHLVEILGKRFDYLNNRLQSTPFLMGEQISVADFYLFTVLRWTTKFKIDLTPWEAIRAYVARINDRPAVRQSLTEEEAATHG